MKNYKSIIWGSILILVGLILALNEFGLTNINIFFKGWWTLFIIIPSFINLFVDNDKTGSFIGIVIGVLLLLSVRNIIDLDIIWKLIIPIILVCIGIHLISRNIFDKEISKKIRELNKKNNNQGYCSTFSSQNINVDEEFEGTNLDAVFGGIKLDLRNSNIKKDIVINANAIFGGIDILVPDDVKVKIKSTSVFGGVSDKKKNKTNNKSYTIYVNATCLFGGVDIK